MICCSSLALCFSCGTSTSKREKEASKYGVGFNIYRKQIGSPVLDSSWTISSKGKDVSGNNFIVWVRKYDGHSPPYFLKKSVIFNKDTIISEEKHFVGKGCYTTLDGTTNDELFTYFNFSDRKGTDAIQKRGWMCTLRDQKTINIPEKERISKIEADSVLKSWGIEPD
jgi:hypothetical protein